MAAFAIRPVWRVIPAPDLEAPLSIARVITCLCAFLLIAEMAHGQSCPLGMVPAISGVCIDIYEWPNLKGERPRVALSAVFEVYGELQDAETICFLSGKRTCTQREWTAACTGPGGSKYPYGDKFEPGICNNDKVWREPDAERVWRRDEKELNRLNQGAASGSFDRCVSAAGAYDMVGNAEEWVRCDQGKFGWCLVGGFWAHAQSCQSAIITHAPNWHYYETSFRCCLDIPQSS